MTGNPASRRQFLGLLGAAAAGAAASAPITAMAVGSEPPPADGPATPMATLSPYGAHQAGITAPTQRFVDLVALHLLPGTDTEALGRLMRLWTGDIEALMAGRAAPGDTAPELASPNADLTVTVGWGPGVFGIPGLASARPAGLHEIPPMRHDRLEERWSGGDLLLVVGAHDGTSVAHAVRRMVADAAPFARMRWRQSGFWNGFGKDGSPATGRNLFGQVDGSANPSPGTEVFDETVWAAGPGWFEGGTTLVFRRIRMDLDRWDTATRAEQEASIGRRLSDGAPLTGGTEKDDLDLTAFEGGRPAISMRAHARLAHPQMNNGFRIFRKGLNYTHDDGSGGTESGLLFLSHQADIARQFTPMQQRLDMADLLNEWTTATGSAVFAVLPGFVEGGWLGDTLLA
ncbi:MAG TPA: Dyp-type peroxidase [Nocardioidaceae bacterium]|nr:Dyp-type peroxidase [Nocardioidaceae bacterium]